MKTLEITTASGTYLVLDLPEVAKDAKLLPVFQSSLVNDVKELVTYNIDGKVEFSDIYLPFSNWQLIGPGKDHHELVWELGLLSENPYGFIEPECGETCGCAGICYALAGWREAEKRVFKNPFILEKS